MIKVFLVEDEYAIREGIKRTIRWEEDGFCLVGEAGDGEVAYPKILAAKPDILITDIRMPFMDGLELSKLVKKELPNIKILILSGYDDFSYAKEAISIGVEEYLLKPISEEILMNELKKVSESIRSQEAEKRYRELYKKEREEIRNLEKQKFFKDIIDGKLHFTELLDQGKSLGIDVTSAWYQPIVMNIVFRDSDESNFDAYSNTKENVYQKIKEYHNGLSDAYMYEQAGDVFCILKKGNTEEDIIANTNGYVDKIDELLRDQEVKYYLSIGRPVERIRDVGASYKSAVKRFAQRFMYDENHVFVYMSDEGDGQAKKGVSTQEKIDFSKLDIGKISQKYIQNFLRNGSQMEVHNFVTDYFESMYEEAMGSMILRQYVVIGAIFSIMSFLESMSISKADIEEKIGRYQDAGKYINSLEETKQCTEELLTEAIKLRNQVSEKKYTELIESAREYIQNNYQNDDLSLQSVASSVNVSSNHFSAIFRKETGETFIEYLTTVRMDKAKELLLCTSMKTSEIGFEVGYKDPHYFSYIFKKIHSVSPKEYRKAKQKTDEGEN